jgi:hypothetical protein
MINLPNDLKSLNQLLLKVMDDKRKALLALEHFKEERRSDLEDKYIAAPVEEAKSLGKLKEEIEKLKFNGRAKVEVEFKKLYERKEKELKLSEFPKNIRKIKDKIIYLETQNTKVLSEDTSTSEQPKAQERFELNY